MSHDFSISPVEKKGPVALLRLEGRLEAKSAQEFWRECRQIREEGCLHLVVNLSGVTFVASSGIGTILALTEEFGDAGGSIQYVEIPEAVESIVEAMNLAQFLHLAPSETEALATAGV